MNPAIARYKHALERAHASTRRAREKAGEMMESVLHGAETGASAFAFGLWAGSAPDKKSYELFGIPAPLIAAAAFHGAAAFGVGRGMEDHFKALGNGALAAHAFGLGQQIGERKKATGNWSLHGEERPTMGPRREGAGVTAEQVAAFAS